jgi:phosphatidylglycerol lysyltransferase
MSPTTELKIERSPALDRHPADVLGPLDLPAEDVVARWGRSSVSPFMAGPGRSVMRLEDGGVAGYVRRGRWAVLATDVVSPGDGAGSLDETLAAIEGRRLRPVFVSVADVGPYVERGLHAMPVAEDPVVDLAGFSLSGKRRASIRHSVSAAKRAGLTVLPWSPDLADGAAEVSRLWLSRKHGGEMGFTLGRFDPEAMTHLDARVAVDGDGRVVGFVTWLKYGGSCRVLDLMRRLPDAPNPTMDVLVAQSLLEFAEAGLTEASLGCVPLSRGRLAERIYPTVSLRRYKEKFAPEWSSRWLVAPSRRHVPGALVAVARAYCPDGIRAAVRSNG